MKTSSFRRLANYSAAGAALVLQLFAFTSSAQESITVSSTAFEHDTDIPIGFSAYGDNRSPDINWSSLPEGTKQVALILEDPRCHNPLCIGLPTISPRPPPGCPQGSRQTQRS